MGWGRLSQAGGGMERPAGGAGWGRPAYRDRVRWSRAGRWQGGAVVGGVDGSGVRQARR